MELLSWIIFGTIIGALANLIMPSDDPAGFIVLILVGIDGALAGGFAALALGFGVLGGLSFGSSSMAILGAILLLFLYRLVMGKPGGP